jgi:hypothetical protein
VIHSEDPPHLSNEPEGLAPAVASPECHSMPESDDADIRGRRNELGCPQTFGEVSHIPRGDRDSVTTFGGILDPLRGVIGCATFPSASSPDAVTKFGCGEIGRSGSSTSAAVSALSSRVKATLIVSTFPSQGDRCRVTESCFGD